MNLNWSYTASNTDNTDLIIDKETDKFRYLVVDIRLVLAFG